MLTICIGGLLVSGNVVKRSEDYEYYDSEYHASDEENLFVKTTKSGADALLFSYKEKFDVKSKFINTLMLALDYKLAINI